MHENLHKWLIFPFFSADDKVATRVLVDGSIWKHVWVHGSVAET